MNNCFPSGVNRDLLCPYCFCKFVNPVKLSCGHNICERCVEKLEETDMLEKTVKSLSLQDEPCKSPIKCPVCFRRVNGDPVPNTELRRYLEKRVDDTPSKEVGMCDECGEKRATKYWIECGSGYYKTFAGLCDECWDAQHKSTIKSHHTLSPKPPNSGANSSLMWFNGSLDVFDKGERHGFPICPEHGCEVRLRGVQSKALLCQK